MSQSTILLKSEEIIDSSYTAKKIQELIAINRGINSDEINYFLSPPSPLKFTPKDFGVSSIHLTRAVKRIKKAISRNEKILIYGDYDVDGITSTAILWRTLKSLSADVTPFIPDRQDDGYGVRFSSYDKFQKQNNCNYDLLITVDNGIVANSEIKKITDLGTDIVIVDHHVSDKVLPQALAIIHSVDTSGAGLAWLLAFQLSTDADLGLAALGVVGDCLPLVGINRSIVVHGLLSLRLNPNSGVKKLTELSGKKISELSAFDLGYVIGPRINAAGRLSNPTDALRLLCSDSESLVSRYASILDGFNQDRQQMQKEGIGNALDLVDLKDDKLIFSADKSYHPGIIGLIAGRLSEKYYLPSIAISIGDEVSKGSCRSIKELNIISALRECSDMLLELGGHEAAAGFSIKTKDISEFQKKITGIINDKLSSVSLSPSLEVDAQMKLSAATSKNYFALKKLEPFGIGNQEPVFLFKNLKVISKRLVGQNGDHLKLKLDDPETKNIENVGTDAIAFRQGSIDGKIKTGCPVNIVASLDLNTWNGLSYPQLIVKEIFPI